MDHSRMAGEHRMTHDTFAPWAEPMADDHAPMRAEDLARLPDSGRGYELVAGRLVKMTPAGLDHGDIASELNNVLRAFVKQHRLGKVFAAETGFLLSNPGEPDTVLAPDVSFVRAERMPPKGSLERRGFGHMAPDLVVEVASPNQYRPELASKARLWLAAGVRLVWIVWPDSQQIDVWQPGRDPYVRTLRVRDTLDGGDVLPGFAYRVAALFPYD